MEPNTPRAEAERWLGIASKLLASRDLVGSRSFAIRARESDPTNPISEQIIAIVDTLIAAEKRVINSSHHDWYSILQLSHLARDLDLIASQYRRLVLLLNPDHNHFPFADYALRVVVDAWSVLSDPTKKWIYDSELSIFLQRSSAPPDPEPVRVDSSAAAATYQFFQQPPQQQQEPPPQQQQWIHHLHQPEQQQPQVQLQERQLFQQQHHTQPPPPQQQHQWLPQTQLQQLLPEQQRPSQPQWLPQSPQPHQPQPQLHHPQPHPPPQTQQWAPEQQQRPPPQPKEPHNPPQLQRQVHQPQPQQPKQGMKASQPPPPPARAQTPPFLPPPQPPPQQPPQPPRPQPPPQVPEREKNGNERGTENGNKENDCNDSANIDENDDGGEQIESFWTACPYCYYLYEYPKTFHDCTLRCQNCRRAFQAIQVPGPPGSCREASFCSWGFFPLGFSMTSWKKSMPKGFGSNWMPFSPMFACPVQEVKKKVWEIIDEDEDELDASDSSDDPDSSDDWGSTRKKVRRGRGRPRKKSNSEKEKMTKNDAVNKSDNDTVNKAKNDTVNKAVASGNLRKQTGKGVRGRKKLDLNVEFSNEVEDHATVTREGNNGEEVVEFFEGLDEFLSTLPILHVVGDDKAKPS